MTAQSSDLSLERSNTCRPRRFHLHRVSKIRRVRMSLNPITRLQYVFYRTMCALAPPTTQLRQEWSCKRTFRPAQNQSFDICLSQFSIPWMWRLLSDEVDVLLPNKSDV